MGESSPATGPPQIHFKLGQLGESIIITTFILRVENQRKNRCNIYFSIFVDETIIQVLTRMIGRIQHSHCYC